MAFCFVTNVIMDTKYLESNKLIAEFMGIKLPLMVCDYSAIICNSNGHYHKSWDWLMPVVEKISDICGSERKWELYNKFINQEGEKADFLIFRYPKEELYNAVVDFIKFYNTNKELFK